MKEINKNKLPPPIFHLSMTLENLVVRRYFCKHYFVAKFTEYIVSIYDVSWSKVNRKERIRPFLFVCFFVVD